MVFIKKKYKTVLREDLIINLIFNFIDRALLFICDSKKKKKNFNKSNFYIFILFHYTLKIIYIIINMFKVSLLQVHASLLYWDFKLDLLRFLWRHGLWGFPLIRAYTSTVPLIALLSSMLLLTLLFFLLLLFSILLLVFFLIFFLFTAIRTWKLIQTIENGEINYALSIFPLVD